jgi:hypothetical protein
MESHRRPVRAALVASALLALLASGFKLAPASSGTALRIRTLSCRTLLLKKRCTTTGTSGTTATTTTGTTATTGTTSTPTTTTTTPSPNQTFLNPFPAGSLWNSALPANPAVDPASADKINYWLTQIPYPNMVLRKWATAVAVSTSGSPAVSVTCTVYACPSMNQFGPVPIPAGTQPDPSGDGHLAVWDPATHHEWDFWVSKCPSDCAHTSSGGSLSTDATAPWMKEGAANAAGWPLLAGIVHPDEIAAGHVDHPLIFATPNVGTGYVCPAVHSDGKNTDARALKEGMLLQLDPSLDVGALSIPDWQKTLARAMQRYGMYLVDGGGTLSVGAENPINRGDLWGQVGLSGDSALFSSSFPWKRMHVLAPPKPWC